MFGRRRRIEAARLVPRPELGDEQILGLLHGKLSELLGAQGAWTLMRRASDDTDVIFHDLKVDQIARDLTEILRVQTSVLRGDIEGPAPTPAQPDAPLTESEPSALSWTPAPISVWAEPERTPAGARLVA